MFVHVVFCCCSCILQVVSSMVAQFESSSLFKVLIGSGRFLRNIHSLFVFLYVFLFHGLFRVYCLCHQCSSLSRLMDGEEASVSLVQPVFTILLVCRVPWVVTEPVVFWNIVEFLWGYYDSLYSHIGIYLHLPGRRWFAICLASSYCSHSKGVFVNCLLLHYQFSQFSSFPFMFQCISYVLAECT